MDQYINEKALAARWGLSPRTLQRWRYQGKGPAHLKLGGRVLYRLSDIETWETRNRRPGADRDAQPPR